ncbi:MAG: hypothetical protein KUG77_16350 [Nannocystaceae bacterium]|nr:hypothetical protein [Nannocystaceae bacterium]
MSEFRSEFCPEYGVWVLKRVDCETSIGEKPGIPQPPLSAAALTLRVVEAEPAARS